MAVFIRTSSPATTKRSNRSRFIRQVRASSRHYLYEISNIRTASGLFDWVYYKFPTLFPLRPYPPVVNIELTNVCNFSCPRGELNNNRGLDNIRFEVFKKIVEESKGQAREMRFIGLGEPCLHPQFDEIMLLLRDSGLKTRPYTNGTLFRKFSPATILNWAADEIVVSIDGTDKRSFERLRVGGDYARLYNDLEAFVAYRATWKGRRTRLQVRHVIMPNETSQELDEFARFWRDRFADTVKFNRLADPFGHARVREDWRPSCRDIRREIHIRYDGRVPLCGYNGQREWIGDVANSSIEKIWRSFRLEEVRRLHQRHDLKSLDFCKTCQFW